MRAITIRSDVEGCGEAVEATRIREGPGGSSRISATGEKASGVFGGTWWKVARRYPSSIVAMSRYDRNPFRLVAAIVVGGHSAGALANTIGKEL